jgi:hypothetical protein
MPYIPYIPAPALATPGTLSGTGIASTVVTYDPSLPLNAIAKELNQVAFYLAGGIAAGATVEPGSMPALMSDISSSNATMASYLKDIRDESAKISLAIVTASDAITQAASTLTALSAIQLATQQLAVADQIHHNNFNETAVNVARAENSSPDHPLAPVAVTPDSLQKSVSTGIGNILNIQSQTFASGHITSALGFVATTGQGLATKALGQTELGKDIMAKYAALKKQALALDPAKISAEVTDSAAKAAETKLKNPTGTSTTPVK